MRDVEGACSTRVAPAVHGKLLYQHSGARSRRLNHVTPNAGGRVGIQTTESQHKPRHLRNEAPGMFSAFIFQIVYRIKAVFIY